MFVAWKLDFLSLMKTHIPEHHCWFWIPATTREQHARLISHNHLHIEAVGKYRSVSSVHTVFTVLRPLLSFPCGRIHTNVTESHNPWTDVSASVQKRTAVFVERRLLSSNPEQANKQTNKVVRRLLSRLQRTWFSLKALGFYVHMIVCIFILFGFRRLPLSYR